MLLVFACCVLVGVVVGRPIARAVAYLLPRL